MLAVLLCLSWVRLTYQSAPVLMEETQRLLLETSTNTSTCGLCDEYDNITASSSTTESPTSTTADPFADCEGKECVYLIFYYNKPGQVAFKKAAETKKKEIMSRAAYDEETDCVVMLPFLLEADFKKQWADASKLEDGTIKAAYIYGHSSKGCDNDGIEFPDGTLTQTEMGTLEILPWHEEGALYIHSCNSGVVGRRGWSLVTEFVKRQKTTTYGEPGYAYFSKNESKYERIPDNEADVKKEKDIYLRAYHRRRNPGSSGKLMVIVCKAAPNTTTPNPTTEGPADSIRMATPNPTASTEGHADSIGMATPFWLITMVLCIITI